MIKRITTLLTMGLLIILFATACSSAPSPQDTVQKFFNALQQKNFEEAQSYINGEKSPITYDSEEQKEIIENFLDKINCEILSSEIKGDNATVKVKITAPDLLRIATKAISEMLPLAFATAFSDDPSSQEEMNKMLLQYFVNSLNDPNVPSVVTETTISLTKTENKWLIEPSADFLNALTGNMQEAFGVIEEDK